MFVKGYEMRRHGDDRLTMSETRKESRPHTLVVGAIVVLALALWQLRLLVALLFFAFILAAAMRPAVEAARPAWCPAHGRDRLHYLVAARPDRRLPVARRAARDRPGRIRPRRYSADALGPGEQARNSTGIKHDVLANIQKRLVDLPTAGSLVDPALR